MKCVLGVARQVAIIQRGQATMTVEKKYERGKHHLRCVPFAFRLHFLGRQTHWPVTNQSAAQVVDKANEFRTPVGQKAKSSGFIVFVFPNLGRPDQDMC